MVVSCSQRQYFSSCRTNQNRKSHVTTECKLKTRYIPTGITTCWQRGESHVICVDQPRRRGIANCSQVEVVGCSQEEEMFMFTGWGSRLYSWELHHNIGELYNLLAFLVSWYQQQWQLQEEFTIIIQPVMWLWINFTTSNVI